MNRPILFLLFLTGFALCYNGIGDRLLYNAFSHSALPLTVNDATNAGWAVFNSSCDSYRGIEYAKDGGPTHSFPITLYFTSGGQISGFAITIWGSYYPATYSDYYFFEPIGDGVWKISLSFRAPSMMCSGAVDSTTPVGDRVVLSQGIENLITPLTPEVAAQKLWTSGGCIGGMGRHWGYDLRTAPQISNIVSNLVPIMPMYNNDAISAVLISINATERVYPFGSWEGPFIPSLFCYNLCEAGCTFDTDFFSTMHFFFTDPNLNKCESHCPTKESVVIN